MTVPPRYVTRARKIYCGTVFAAALVGLGVGQWLDGVAAVGVSLAFALTLPLSLYGYFLIAYAWFAVGDLVGDGESSVMRLVGAVFVSAGFALMALVQFGVARRAGAGIVRVARSLCDYRTPGRCGQRLYP